MKKHGLTPAVAQVFMGQVRKAAESGSGDEVRKILDLWESEWEALTEEEIKTGPVEESSGEGAYKMIRDYSDVARQKGIEKLYEEVARLLDDSRAMKAAIEALVKKGEEEKEEKKEEKEEKMHKAEKEDKEDKKSPGDFGEEYKDSERAAKSFARALLKELADGLKDPAGFEKEEKKDEENDNQAAHRASKANDDHDEHGRFAVKPGSEKEDKVEEKSESLADLRSRVKELSSLVAKLAGGEAKKSDLTGDPVPSPVFNGRQAAPINLDALNGVQKSTADAVLSKAYKDFEDGVLPQAVKSEIETISVIKRHVDGGVAPRQVLDGYVKSASPMARAYFEG